METLRFEDVDIHCLNDEGKLWFCEKDVLLALEYSSGNISTISSRNKKSLSELIPDTVHHDGLAAYIDEFGILKLVMTSRKPKARDFERFIEIAIGNLKDAAFESLKSVITSHEEKIRGLQAENCKFKEKIDELCSHIRVIKRCQKLHIDVLPGFLNNSSSSP